jgi:hypothetical protein
MACIISGYRFTPEGPLLQLDDLGVTPTHRSYLSVRGRACTLSWSETRFCTGYRDLATRSSLPCPQKAQVTGKSDMCWSCDQRTGFNPSFYNVAPEAISVQQQRYNQQKHVVYLAAFSADTVKVGITTESRGVSRLREQGARRGVIVAQTSDAYSARSHEAAIHEWLYLPEVIRSGRKLALLSERFDAAAVSGALSALRERAERELELPRLSQPIMSFDADYLGDNVLEPPLVDLTDVSPAMISGVGVGLVGDILVMREADRQLALSLKPVIGCVVEHVAQVRPNVARPAQQMGFGF